MKARTAAIAASATLIAALGIGYKVTQDRGYVPQTLLADVPLSTYAPPMGNAHVSVTPPLWGQEIFNSSFEDDTNSCPREIVLPDGSRRTLVTTIPVTYGIYPPVRKPIGDGSAWESIWGAGSVTGPVQPWPGPTNTSPVMNNFNGNGYVGSRFAVPTGVRVGQFGQFSHAPNPPGPDIHASYSTRCGDFNPGPRCVTLSWPDDISSGLYWMIHSANQSFCSFEPGMKLWQNETIANPSDCVFCQIYLQHQHN